MDVITLKIGGTAADHPVTVRHLGEEIQSHQEAGEHQFLLIHGGGNDVTELSKQFGIEPVFHNGIRLTSPEEMDLVEMVLAGKVNKRLVRQLSAMGLAAVGLSGADGGIFTGQRMKFADGIPSTWQDTRTGRIAEVKIGLLQLLLRNGYLPVISSISRDSAGAGLNINADAVALSLAPAMASSALVFISDIPGVLKDRKVIQRLSVQEARAEILSGTIVGGMIPKVESSVQALADGVDRVVIGQYGGAGALSALLSGKQGTTIYVSDHGGR